MCIVKGNGKPSVSLYRVGNLEGLLEMGVILKLSKCELLLKYLGKHE